MAKGKKPPQLKCESSYTFRASNGEHFVIPCDLNFSHEGECLATLTWKKAKGQPHGR